MTVDRLTIRRARWAAGMWDAIEERRQLIAVKDDLARRVEEFNKHREDFDAIVDDSISDLRGGRDVWASARVLFDGATLEETIDQAAALLDAEQERLSAWIADFNHRIRLLKAEQAALGEASLTERPEWAYQIVAMHGWTDPEPQPQPAPQPPVQEYPRGAGDLTPPPPPPNYSAYMGGGVQEQPPTTSPAPRGGRIRDLY